MRQTQH